MCVEQTFINAIGNYMPHTEVTYAYNYAGLELKIHTGAARHGFFSCPMSWKFEVTI